MYGRLLVDNTDYSQNVSYFVFCWEEGGFYGISTIADYLMPNALYACIYIKYKWVVYIFLLITFLNEPDLIFGHS